MQVQIRDEHFDADRIRAVRKRYGMTQEQFALALDVTLRAVSMWETSRRTPRDYVTISKLLYLEREALPVA